MAEQEIKLLRSVFVARCGDQECKYLHIYLAENEGDPTQYQAMMPVDAVAPIVAMAIQCAAGAPGLEQFMAPVGKAN